MKNRRIREEQARRAEEERLALERERREAEEAARREAERQREMAARRAEEQARVVAEQQARIDALRAQIAANEAETERVEAVNAVLRQAVAAAEELTDALASEEENITIQIQPPASHLMSWPRLISRNWLRRWKTSITRQNRCWRNPDAGFSLEQRQQGSLRGQRC